MNKFINLKNPATKKHFLIGAVAGLLLGVLVPQVGDTVKGLIDKVKGGAA